MGGRSFKKHGKKSVAQNQDYSKLRLQLFYLDDLVQIASESLCHMEGTTEVDQGAKRAQSRSPSPNVDSHNSEEKKGFERFEAYGGWELPQFDFGRDP